MHEYQTVHPSPRLFEAEAALMFRHAERFIGEHFHGHDEIVADTTAVVHKSPRVVVGRGTTPGTLLTGIRTADGHRSVRAYPALTLGGYALPSLAPNTPEAVRRTRASNAAVFEAVRSGVGRPDAPDARPGPFLTLGGTIYTPAHPWPVYPHELGLIATDRELAEADLVAPGIAEDAGRWPTDADRPTPAPARAVIPKLPPPRRGRAPVPVAR